MGSSSTCSSSDLRSVLVSSPVIDCMMCCLVFFILSFFYRIIASMLSHVFRVLARTSGES